MSKPEKLLAYRKKRDFRRTTEPQGEPPGSPRGKGLRFVEAGDRIDAAKITGATAGRLPSDPKPELATLVGEPPKGEGWLHEIKFDGYRLLCRIDGGKARLISRNGKDWTDRFSGIAEAVRRLPCGAALLDGEAVVQNERGASDFQALQNTIRDRRGDVLYFVFDLLYLEEYDLTESPLAERKAALARLLSGTEESGIVRYSDHVAGNGARFYKEACRMGLEGIVSKRADAPYRARRTRSWLKVKCLLRQEFVIVGFTDPSGSRVGFGSLLLAVNDAGGNLVSAGRVGTGFDNALLRQLHQRLEKIERKTAPIEDAPKGTRARGIHWVTPRLVAEVGFTEWTRDGVVRHPSFQGLREDRSPDQVVRETPAANPAPASGAPRKRAPRSAPAGSDRIAGVRLTHPDRVVYPEQGITKRELALYYEQVAELALPYLADRPLTLLRCPSGRHGSCFFQKHANESIPEVVPRVPIDEDDGSTLYMMIDSLPALISLVQLGVLEFHVWGARADRLDRPDMVVFDLDPGPEVSPPRVAAAALDLRERLEHLGLKSFVRSTGGKGLHLAIPIVRRTTWDDAKAFAEAIAAGFAEERPREFTRNMAKRARQGKIYIDYLRNAPNATAIASYSTRARPDALVAAPLAWDELDSTEAPPRFTVRNLPPRIKAIGDAWQGFDSVSQSITAAMKREVGL